MTEFIDFTGCKRIFGRAYNGANGKKIAVEFRNELYMLKFPPSAQKKPTDLSYANSCLSEYIACNILNMMGIKAQETLLGTFTVNGKEKIVCACKDFTAGGKVLYDFCSIKNTIIDSEHNGNGTELSDILETIEKQQFVSPQKLKEHFWNVFVTDAFLGNFDRHNGNWGFLYDNQSKTCEIAPVFDCGSCLLPQADEGTMRSILIDNDEMNARIFHYPTSAIRLNGKKINYYDFLVKAEYEDCNQALMRMVSEFDKSAITDFIYGIPYLSDLQKEFYTKYIGARFERLIIPANENVLELQRLSEAESKSQYRGR